MMRLRALLCTKTLALCMCAIAAWLVATPPANAADASKLIGAWHIVSIARVNEQTSTRSPEYDASLKGYLVFLPSGRMIAFITGKRRSRPADDSAPDAQQFWRDGMMAYSGPSEVADDSFTTRVDMAWDQSWIGTAQKRLYTLSGDKLVVKTGMRTRPDGARTYLELVWQRDR